MKKIFIGVICFFMVSSLAACGIAARNVEKPEDKKDTAETTTTAEKPTEAKKTEYAIGETWTVDGQWTLTILGATETDYRNQFSEKNPAAVYIVDYVYTNLGYDGGLMDGLYFNIEDTIVDAGGQMGYSYPGTVTNYPQETPIGATCYAQACIGVDNPGTFTLSVDEYDSDYDKYSAKFVVDPTLPYAEYTPEAGPANNTSALKIGETWTVDGLWTLTITGVYATDERNQFSEKNPGAVYIVDYSYTNLGYEGSIMDGLYMTIDDMIVDAGGQMGYSYPGTLTNYPQETPIGATCNAQACIGVDNPGSFTVTVSEYDDDYDKYTQSFLIEVE